MRLMHGVVQAEAPHSLILNNNSNDLDGNELKKSNEILSAEVLNHRIQKGWQHLQATSTALNNNNNKSPFDTNINNNIDEASSFASSSESKHTFLDGEYREMSSEDSESSSDEDSSASYSDTSPLLDVSSLENSDAEDSDMSDDSTSTSSNFEDEYVGNDDNNNDDTDEGEEVEEEEEMPTADRSMLSMQSSWMSVSSSSSLPNRNSQIVLPDVLPVGSMPIHINGEEDEGFEQPASITKHRSSNVEISLRNGQELGSSRNARERCLVEIKAQPDIQVDIRVNPVSARPYRESKSISIRHGNTYPREARNSKRYLRNRDINAWIVNDSFDEHYDDGTTQCWALDEGIHLNNYTIVNKTLSLTELGNNDSNLDNETLFSSLNDDRSFLINNPSKLVSPAGQTNSLQNFERNYSKLPHCAQIYKDHWRFQDNTTNSITKQKSVSMETNVSDIMNASAMDEDDIIIPLSDLKLEKEMHESNYDNSEQISICESSETDKNSNKIEVERLLPKPMETDASCPISQFVPKGMTSSKTSPELFEVFTMESALPSINWSSHSKGGRESEWIRKRRNDREEIRRKLAMDSDTEDYISEKLSQHRANADSFDRLSGAGNLQICFMNEAAKDQDFSNPEDEGDNKKEPIPEVHQQQPPVIATAANKHNSAASKTLLTTLPSKVVKRQRPKFFFNRPRSWHASKHDERLVDEAEPEDLQTRHTRLQAEAREALSQAKDMARMQMEIERQKKKKSPIVDIVGLPFPDGKNLLTYHALVAMNLAQLQVIVNDLHSQIETLNEDLVKFLLERDDLHMEQDSMLVDIEDLTRYLGLKGTTSSSSSKVSADNSSEKKEPKVEPVRRSQSVHLKSKNLMWPLQLTLFNSGYSSKR